MKLDIPTLKAEAERRFRALASGGDRVPWRYMTDAERAQSAKTAPRMPQEQRSRLHRAIEAARAKERARSKENNAG